MKTEEIHFAFKKNQESKIEMALTDDISTQLKSAFESNSRGADLVKQANNQFGAALRFAQAASMSAKDGEDKAKFLGLDASKLTSLRKQADDFMKLAGQNVKKYS